MDTFLSASQIASLKGLVNKGLNTAEAFFDVEVQPRRRDGDSGRYENHGDPITLIQIKFGLREVSETSGAPIVVRSSDGDIQFWAADYQPINGDRFSYGGMMVEITAIYPEEYDAVVCEVKLIQGSNA